MHIPQTEVILRHDGAELARVTLPPGEYVIGRDDGVEIFADTPLISRRHAQLTINYDHLLLEDLGSSNGTYVAEQRIAECTRLYPNQAVRLGDVTVELRRERAPSEPGVSLAPAQAAIRRFLPDELLAEKRYAIGSQIARGGMGAILDARQNATQRTVAMKVMLGSGDEGDVLRFIEEAQVTAQLDHPNIVPIYELGVDEQDQLFYTMKLVRGITLKKVLELLAQRVEATVKKYPMPALLTIFQKVCDALALAHSRGVIHRDLKPENIMLGDFGSVLVMDWGLAKVLGGKSAPANGQTAHSVLSIRADAPELGSTMTGDIMGTPQYMAPEQARGEIEKLDARADIYALGAILFEILYLRPTVAGTDAMAIVAKVERGAIEWPAAKELRTAPDSLLAICRQALAFDPAARYRSVEDLQADVLAYQNGFATSAERAGVGKQLLLAVKRHKAASIGVAAVLLVGGVLGTRAVVEGHRANAALADLKKSAPALLQLAENEADAQRFDRALTDIDAATALDPALLPARWQRAWVLLALERWDEAAAALRLAQQRDPAGAQLASILPAVEKVAATPEAGRWKSDEARAIFQHLESIPALGPALALSARLKLGAEERRKLVDQRLLAALGKGNYSISVGNDGLVSVSVVNKPIRSLEAMRGLPIDRLDASNVPITDLEPLRGMQLQAIGLNSCKALSDLGPLRGMPLRWMDISGTQVRDLAPLSQAHLEFLNSDGVRLADLAPLAGQPLTDLTVNGSEVSHIDVLRGMPLDHLRVRGVPIADYSPLKGAPLRSLEIAANLADLDFAQGMSLRVFIVVGSVARIDALRGMPLEKLDLGGSSPADLTPLQDAPLKDLKLRDFKKVTNFAPILTLPALERLTCDGLPPALLPLRASKTLQTIDADAFPGEKHVGARPAAEFWHAYDAHQAAGTK